MTPTVLLLSLTLLQLEPPKKPDFKPHPFAPSLPQLSDEEEKRLDAVIDKFMLFDTGQLKGEEGRKAKEEFDKLGPEATFALIRGMNRAAKLEHSCPALVIAKKLSRTLSTTEDTALLDFAREHIGAGVKQTYQFAVLKDLQLACMLRKNALASGKGLGGLGEAPPRKTPAANLGLKELIEEGSTEKGTRLRLVLGELALREGDEPLSALSMLAMTAYEKANREMAREYLERSLKRQPEKVVKERLEDRHAEMRTASAKVAGSKGYRLGAELIELLNDDFEEVRQAARQALVQLAGDKTDHGPELKADDAARAAAVKKWKAWWAAQSK